ncbi:uncharacterized protein HD556DRAFT_1293420 [Suillus plorans]|uniref:F-box domain-containing protein n=1 Tax=Suillus plorans TaxID=116603 RepID=A0A9P7APH0_9AGAM|nr:uncharacterized protein HD556DRAFT_1293420 [Suillus plorans]KAG1792691.1 hypothetical protein HD556DRAFT_1293420 [Suillus plorans]
MGSGVIEHCDTTRAHVDKDIAALAESLRGYRSRRISLSYISWLPLEILTTIFTYIVEEDTFKSHTGTPRPNGAPISMIITHVCRHWRQVALECPTLWASLNCVSADCLDMMLERSKKIALVVIYRSPGSLRKCFQQILSQLPRIKFLQLCSYPWDVNRILDCLSSQPAPLLQSFKFSVAGKSNYRVMGSISDAVFQGRAPLLRSVELMECTFSWTSCIFSGLRTLDVRRIGSASYPTLSQLLSTLRRMPELEQLTLGLSSRISEDTELSDRVPLTQLKSIALDACTLRNAVSLFSCLAFPVDVKIALNLAPIGSCLSDLFSAMHKDPDGSGPIIRSMRASLSYHTFGVQFGTSTAFKSKYSWDPHNDDILLSIQFKCSSSTRKPPIIFDMCQMVPHCQIQSLFVTSSLVLRENFWRVGSTDLPELENIQLSGTCNMRSLIAVLQSGGTQSSDMAYPSLHALEFENIDFGCGEAEELQDIAIMRAGHGVGIHELRLVKCRNLVDDRVQFLKEVVTDVDWDGHEEGLVGGSGSGGGCLCHICRDESSGEDYMQALLHSDYDYDPDSDAYSED